MLYSVSINQYYRFLNTGHFLAKVNEEIKIERAKFMSKTTLNGCVNRVKLSFIMNTSSR